MAIDLSYGRSPFPFSDRPVLPHIDAYQENEKLKVIKDNNNNNNNSNNMILTSNKIINNDIDHNNSHSYIHNNNIHSHHNDININYGYFNLKEIKHVFKFIKSCGNEDETFGFTLDELETAFRRVKRAIKNREEEYYARRLMNTFEFLLKIKQISPKQWFKTVDTSQANKGDGKLTWLEFETGMNKLCEDLGAALFTKYDLTTMLKYLDPNGDGDLSYHEVTKGFARIHQMADCKAVMINSGPIIPYLQDFMRERQIRVRDLFNFLDIKNKKSVTLEVFCDGISRVGAFIQPSTDQQPQNDSSLSIDSNEDEPFPINQNSSLSSSVTSLSPSNQNNNSQNGVISPLRGLSPPYSSDSNSLQKKHQKRQKELRNRSQIHLPPVKLQNNRSLSSPSLTTNSTNSNNNNNNGLSSSLTTTSNINTNTNTVHELDAQSIRGYERQVKKQFREYDDWLKQFDRKLQNGLILMSKM